MKIVRSGIRDIPLKVASQREVRSSKTRAIAEMKKYKWSEKTERLCGPRALGTLLIVSLLSTYSGGRI
jgi:hypothetical protein